MGFTTGSASSCPVIETAIALTSATIGYVTRLADRMIRAGLIAREACPTDRRVSYLVLTPAGRTKFKAAATTHVRGVRDHFARHLGADTAAVAAALERVAES